MAYAIVNLFQENLSLNLKPAMVVDFKYFILPHRVDRFFFFFIEINYQF